MAAPVPPIDEFAKALATRDIDRAVGLYATDAVVVRYEGVASGVDEIRAFFVGYLSGFDRYDLLSVDQIQDHGDTLVWDSSIETGGGVLQTTNVIVRNGDGLIVRHIPLVRGFWGATN